MIARSAAILRITVIGGLIASYVHINVVTSFAIKAIFQRRAAAGFLR